MPVQILKFRTLLRAALTLGLAAVATLASAAAGEQVVARMFEHAGRLLQQGRPELAVDEFRRLVESYPQSDLADDALLAIGAQSYGVSDVDGLGRAHGAALEEAFKIYDRVRREHPQGNAAPAAIARMALLRLEPRAAVHSLEEARALFLSVSEIYPESEWMDEARLGMGFCSRRSAQPVRVVADLQPFVEALADSPLGPRAHLWRADAFEALGRRTRALETYQRLSEQAPRAPEAAWAQGRAALLLRRTLAEQAAARLAEDTRFASARVPDLRDAPIVSVSVHGWIYLSDGARGRILRLDARGRLMDQKQAQPPALLALDPYGQAAVVEGDSLRLGRLVWPLRVPEGKKMEPLSTAAPPLPRLDGSWWLLDRRGRAVLEFDRSLLFRKVVWSDESLSASRARLGPDDTAWLLDPDSGRLVRVSAAGEPRAIPLRDAPASVRRPADLAVDALGAVWVLDAERRGVAVFSPAGGYEGFVPLEGAGDDADLEAVEVDMNGGILVYDTRQRRLRRFQDPPPAPPAARTEVKP